MQPKFVLPFGISRTGNVIIVYLLELQKETRQAHTNPKVLMHTSYFSVKEGMYQVQKLVYDRKKTKTSNMKQMMQLHALGASIWAL
jgi:hypothetical protein